MQARTEHIFDRLFRAEPMSAIFADERQLLCILRFEAALARAEASTGVIPQSAADAIAARCNLEGFNLQALGKLTRSAGNLAIPIVKQLTALVGQIDPAAARYVHWGTTSQDAIDTGLVLQLRDAFAWFEQEIESIAHVMARLVREHRATLQVGRTWLQQAVPITFGWKMAACLDTMLRHAERLQQLKPRVLVLQFGGAAGTLASLGSDSVEVSEALAAELDLPSPPIPWHTHRDRIAEVATFMGLLAGTMGKLARDLSLQMQTEVGELSEAASEGRGGSSTMPHKRNPVSSAVALSCALRVPALVGTMLSAMVQEHERGLGGWHAEWETLPELCTLTAGALAAMHEALAGIEVSPAAMQANLHKAGGVIMAEAVSMELAKFVGREQAHHLVEQASRHSLEQGTELLSSLLAIEEVTAHLSEQQLHALLEPASYLGSAQSMIDQVLERYDARPRSKHEVAR